MHPRELSVALGVAELPPSSPLDLAPASTLNSLLPSGLPSRTIVGYSYHVY